MTFSPYIKPTIVWEDKSPQESCINTAVNNVPDLVFIESPENNFVAKTLYETYSISKNPMAAHEDILRPYTIYKWLITMRFKTLKEAEQIHNKHNREQITKMLKGVTE